MALQPAIQSFPQRVVECTLPPPSNSRQRTQVPQHKRLLRAFPVMHDVMHDVIEAGGVRPRRVGESAHGRRVHSGGGDGGGDGV